MNPNIGEGSDLDYIVTTSQVSAMFRTPDQLDSVAFTFRLDGVVQEPNETFFLELVPTATTNLPTGDAVFFRNTLNMIIIDNEGECQIATHVLLSLVTSHLACYIEYCAACVD